MCNNETFLIKKVEDIPEKTLQVAIETLRLQKEDVTKEDIVQLKKSFIGKYVR